MKREEYVGTWGSPIRLKGYTFYHKGIIPASKKQSVNSSIVVDQAAASRMLFSTSLSVLSGVPKYAPFSAP
jgi:hypothetical protein